MSKNVSLRWVTSECITDGHPDKVCDQIADAILDCALEQDRNSRMAVEATIKDDKVLIYGEMNTKAELDFEAIAKGVLRDIGYTEDYKVFNWVGQQSPQISGAVDATSEVAAGDQGIMFGYATNENTSMLPYSYVLSIELALRLRERQAVEFGLHPDAKTQVVVEESTVDGVTTFRIARVLVSACHKEGITQDALFGFVEARLGDVLYDVIRVNESFEVGAATDTVTDRVFNALSRITANGALDVNPAGKWTIGGSYGDSGTTGRKIVADTYGGVGRVGGGCFSSKDPSKVDRSAAYMARYVAKAVVAGGYADKCEIGLAYAIGLKDPMSLSIDCFGTNKIDLDVLYEKVKASFDFSVSGIIRTLGLERVKYRDTSVFGHFYPSIVEYRHNGLVDVEYPWEYIATIQ